MTKTGWARLFWFVHMFKKKKVKKKIYFTHPIYIWPVGLYGKPPVWRFCVFATLWISGATLWGTGGDGLAGELGKIKQDFEQSLFDGIFFMDESENSSGMCAVPSGFPERDCCLFFYFPYDCRREGVGGRNVWYFQAVIFSLFWK